MLWFKEQLRKGLECLFSICLLLIVVNFILFLVSIPVAILTNIL